MPLRKLVAALGPLLVCVLAVTASGWVDGWLGANSFWAFALKGLLLGVGLAVALPAGGIRALTNGLTGWLLAGAALLAAVVVYQYLVSAGVLPAAPLPAASGQAVWTESAFAGFLCATAIGYRRR